jgi:hypothetical protein
MKMKLTVRTGRLRRAACTLPLLLLLLTPAAMASDADDDAGVELTWGVKIPMRDGVVLNATLYRPRGTNEKLPALFRMNPYTPDGYHRQAMELVRHGYAFAAVDVRGRGNSGGTFMPFFNDGQDGADVVEWLAKQPWSNGKVGMFGESQLGRAVWSVLKQNPPHLVAAAPLSPGYPLLFWKNILTPDLVQDLSMMAGVTNNANILGDDDFWLARFRELYLKHLPLREFDRLAGFPGVPFQTILDHPTQDAFWNGLVPDDAEYARMPQPLLSMTGQYDMHEEATIYVYRQHLRLARPEVAAQHYLVIGPWDHQSVAHPRREAGGLTFGPASVAMSTPVLLREWFDYSMRGAARPPFLQKRVAYYVIGAEEWRYADNLDDITKRPRTLFLTSTGEAGDVFHSGRLATTAPAGAPNAAAADRWTYDPVDPRPAEVDVETVSDVNTSQRYALNLYGEGAVYHSEPFEKPTEVIGNPRLSAWISMDVRDTDLDATLYLILANGTSVLLGEDYLRARYRHSQSKEELVEPGAIERYDFTFPFEARLMPRGSRLRLVVRSPNNIYWEKNYNSGGEVSRESGKDAHTAHLVLYHDAAHPSALALPVD